MRIKTCLLTVLILSIQIVPAPAQRIQQEHLDYRGAFRLPQESGGSDWNYSGYAMTYYPNGDPNGIADGYPGSIFAVGHDHQQYVSEISIPVPIISQTKNLSELNTAKTLQEFQDITSSMFGYQEMPTAGLAYLPAQGSQTSGKLHFCWGQHIQYQEATHGWCELDLSNPQSAGLWYFGNYNNYTTCDYLFEIPKTWADIYTPGFYLASGRFREGVWSGLGPALYACAPWIDGNPPQPNSTLNSITPLLLYGIDDPAIPEIIISDSMKMKIYSPPDQWSGAAWLTAGENSAVIFVGTKAIGNWWYGYSDGTVWPEEPPYPAVPDAPHDDRGFWSDSISAQIIFYDPADLAAVAQGGKKSYEPQHYATYDINQYLYDPGFHYWRYKKWSLGAACFDRGNGFLYIIERRADEEKSLVHVWKVNINSIGIDDGKKQAATFKLTQNYPNPFSSGFGSTFGENSATTIKYNLHKSVNVNISIYNMLGQRVNVLENRFQQNGSYTVQWDGNNISGISQASGIYICRIQAGGFGRSIKMMLVR